MKWIYIIAGIFIIALIGFVMFLFIYYGSKPPQEVPSWVHWLMNR